jgi:hypothetical protein
VRELYALYNMPVPETALSVSDDLATIGTPSTLTEEGAGGGGL